MTQPRNGDISQHILPTSATMVGVCITLIGIVRLIETHAAIVTIGDNLAAIAAVIFLLSTLLSYVSLRTERRTMQIERVADLLFLAGLVLLVACGVMLAWEIGQSPATQPGVLPSSLGARLWISDSGRCHGLQSGALADSRCVPRAPD